jgi:hypothetical protein
MGDNDIVMMDTIKMHMSKRNRCIAMEGIVEEITSVT